MTSAIAAMVAAANESRVPVRLPARQVSIAPHRNAAHAKAATSANVTKILIETARSGGAGMLRAAAAGYQSR
jgi:hypothetical protein